MLIGQLNNRLECVFKKNWTKCYKKESNMLEEICHKVPNDLFYKKSTYYVLSQ